MHNPVRRLLWCMSLRLARGRSFGERHGFPNLKLQQT